MSILKSNAHSKIGRSSHTVVLTSRRVFHIFIGNIFTRARANFNVVVKQTYWKKCLYYI